MQSKTLFPAFGGNFNSNSASIEQIHFLHIGKNAGTQIKFIIEQVNSLSNKKIFHSYGHDTVLKDLPGNSKYFFSIRHPFTRFFSGFYSRKRKGQPRLNVEWTEHEKFAFENFSDANDLAESLYKEGVLGYKATQAIKSIRHTAQNQIDWFCRVGAFLEMHPPVWIIRQECFDLDISHFLTKACINEEVQSKIIITKDKKLAHLNDYEGVPSLSEKAKLNLMNWYSQDIEFYKLCENWILENSQKL